MATQDKKRSAEVKARLDALVKKKRTEVKQESPVSDLASPEREEEAPLPRKPSPFDLPFGKYKGSTIEEVPWHYLLWCAGYFITDDGQRGMLDTDSFVWVQTRYPEFVTQARKRLEGMCWECRKPLTRKNGKDDAAWKNPILHKQCWSQRKRMKESSYSEEDSDTPPSEDSEDEDYEESEE